MMVGRRRGIGDRIFKIPYYRYIYIYILYTVLYSTVYMNVVGKTA